MSLFERLALRAAAAAKRRAEARARELAETLIAERLDGVKIEADGMDVRLSGRGLRWRAATEPALRNLSGRGG